MNLLSLTPDTLADYLCRQLDNFFPDGKAIGYRPLIVRHLNEALQRAGHCIDNVKLWPQGQFNYLHSTQYCQFLYYLANTIWREGGDTELCTRLFFLNKSLNGIDLFYEIAMPEIFFIGHSVGLVFAKATYGNYLVAYQNSTVGKNHGVAPTLGEGVIMYPNTAIIGRCQVADGAVIAQGVSVINHDVPADSIAYAGSAGELVFRARSRSFLEDIFRL